MDFGFVDHNLTSATYSTMTEIYKLCGLLLQNIWLPRNINI